ncbi:MAG: efflux RND transporter periplasmic adaptor subunit [Cyanobacteria bacterium P01_F01_bin.86]
MTLSNLSSSEPLQPIMAKDHSSGFSRWLVAGSLGVLFFAGGFIVWRFMGSRGRGPVGFPPAAAVTLEAVQSGQVQDRSEFLGDLEAQTGVVLQPEVSGRITQVFVAAGDRVNPGDPIVLISPDRTQAEVSAAQASVAVAQAATGSTAASLRSLQSRETELKAELALRLEEFRRTSTLVDQGALSKQDLDFARRDLEVAEAAVTAAQEDIAAAEASLSQSEASLAQAEANQAAAEENLQDRTVTAPVVGTIGDIRPKLGDYVTPSDVITSITENTSLELDLEVPIEQRDRLSLGLPVELMGGNGQDILASGSVIFISPQINADTQTVLIKAQFDNPQGLLQDAQKVEARLIWSEQTGLLVPTSAITRLGGQTFVYIAETASPEELPPPEALPPGMPMPEQVARLRPVQLGDIQGNNYQILSGIEAGETIVVSGILNLQDGTPILPAADGEPQAGQ